MSKISRAKSDLDHIKQIIAANIFYNEGSDYFVANYYAEDTSEACKNLYRLTAKQSVDNGMCLNIGKPETKIIPELNTAFTVHPLTISWNGLHDEDLEEIFRRDIREFEISHGVRIVPKPLYTMDTPTFESGLRKMFKQIASNPKWDNAELVELMKYSLDTAYIIKTDFNGTVRYHQCCFDVASVLKKYGLLEWLCEVNDYES